MITLKHLKVRGFRAYLEDKEFDFDNPAILLFGENHQGKSSTLNAIEWCFFGNACIGAKSGIRERIGWEVPNRYLGPSSEVYVELELEDNHNHSYTILRRWISQAKDELIITLPEGKSLEGDQAEEKLTQILQLSFRDFLTTVYQHQEVIRAILTQQPKQRNDAIDRLLGLSDYRNILAGIRKAKLPTEQKEMGKAFDKFTDEIDVALRTRESDLNDKKEKALQKGLKDDQLCEDGVLGVANHVKEELLAFASEVNLSLTDLEVPESWRDLDQFQKIAGQEINRFRAEMPDVRQQQDLFDHRGEIEKLKIKYERAKQDLCEARSDLDDFVKQNGDEEALNKRKTEIEEQIEAKTKELEETSAKAAAVRNSIDYLKLEGVNQDKCPVCGKETTDLLRHLKAEWDKRFEKQLGGIRTQIKELKTQLGRVEGLLSQYNALQGDVNTAKKRVGKIVKEIGDKLDREITSKDDPSIILKRGLDEIELELDKLEKAVDAKQKRLNEIGSSLEKVQLIVDILALAEKKKIVEQIEQSSEYQQLEGLKTQMAFLVNDVDMIKQAISETSHEEAEQKVSTAGEIIDQNFCQIANNPSVTEIQFSVSVDSRTASNSYEFKDQDGKDLTPILSQGDLNALALSIFLGMASSEETNQPLEFIMLDDPTQSLGSDHKEKLVEVLNQVLEERTVILSSMDKELQDLILSKITKAKTRYMFSDWTRSKGPQVEKM